MQIKTQAERQASVVSKFQTNGLSSLTTDDVVIILEQVDRVGPGWGWREVGSGVARSAEWGWVGRLGLALGRM